MAAELISAKLIAPYYGNSLIVWTSVFVFTLSGLALGYFYGARLSGKPGLYQNLFLVLAFSTLFFAFMSPLSDLIMESTLSLPIELGSLLSVLVFLFPLLMAFGTVSPLIIRLLTNSDNEAGEKSGMVYAVSTLGGILTTLFFGYYFIPYVGITLSIICSTLMMAVATALGFYLYKRNIPTNI